MSSTPDISIQNLRKTYNVPEREPGLGAALKSLIRRKTRDVEAVKDICFNVAPGEIVGFLGPNGAGKTTTLKMLSGLLHPTSGEISVLGYTPFARHKDFLSRITLVMGQRNQLMWDIPVADSFERNRAIYRIPHSDYNTTLNELNDLLDLSDLLSKPVRNLSLGERMKCEIAAALLHRPQVLFLDEPTASLDPAAAQAIEEIIRHISGGETKVVLATQDLAQARRLGEQIVFLSRGKVVEQTPASNFFTQPATTQAVAFLNGEAIQEL